jgi:general L-amino acid transport system permease protein
MNEEKTPLWRDNRFWKIAGQGLIVIILLIIISYFANNLRLNLQQLGLNFGFDFLNNPASFNIGDKVIDYQSTDPYSKAILVGLLNSLRVMFVGIILATFLGIIIGIGRLSDNWLLRQISSIYVQTLRNTPLLLQLFFWYFVVFLKLPKIDNPLIFLNSFYLSNRGMDIPWPENTSQTWLSLVFLFISIMVSFLLGWQNLKVMENQGKSNKFLPFIFITISITCLLVFCFGLSWQIPQLDGQKALIQGGLNLSPEFATILFALTFYTAAFIAEIVRGGILSVNKGQWEAAKALGLKPNLILQLVIFPQALRVIIPPLTSEFLNLIKNSSLAVAIGYNDIYAVASTTSNQTGKAIEMLLIVMTTYLIINLIISSIMNVFNRLVQIKER